MSDTPDRERPAHLWKPGQSGNPGGKPKGLERRVREIVGPDLDAMITALVDIALARGNMGAGAKVRDRVAAASLVLNRGWGAPKQTVVVESDQPTTEITINVNVLPDGDLDQLETLLERAQESERKRVGHARDGNVIDVEEEGARALPAPSRP